MQARARRRRRHSRRRCAPTARRAATCGRALRPPFPSPAQDPPKTAPPQLMHPVASGGIGFTGPAPGGKLLVGAGDGSLSLFDFRQAAHAGPPLAAVPGAVTGAGAAAGAAGALLVGTRQGGIYWRAGRPAGPLAISAESVEWRGVSCCLSPGAVIEPLAWPAARPPAGWTSAAAPARCPPAAAAPLLRPRRGGRTSTASRARSAAYRTRRRTPRRSRRLAPTAPFASGARG
jgi:hypothetical protein